MLWGISFLNGDVFDEDGGAIHSHSTNPTIQNCLFINNAASRGGAIFLEGSSPLIQDSFILSNVATSSGGGIYSDSTSDPLIENTLIEDNAPDQLHDFFRNEPDTTGTAESIAKDSDDDTEILSSRAGPTPAEKDSVNGRDKIRDLKTKNRNTIPLIPILPAPGPVPFPNPAPVADSDGDGLPDQWEVNNLLSPRDPSDRMTDPDRDGFGNAYEFFHNTDPQDRSSAPSPTLYVDPSFIAPVGPGPQTTFRTIQAALDSASDYDVIELADGTYTGASNKNLDYQGKSVMLLSQNGPSHTVIDCQGNGRGFQFFNGEDERSVLRGVTIKNGHADRGAGISCETSSPAIQRCILVNNHAVQEGGGIYNDTANPIVENCILAHNEAQIGAGLFNGRSATPIVLNCTVADNIATLRGGGIGQFDTSSSPKIQNTILWGNTPEQVDTMGNPEIVSSDVQGSWAGPGNIDADPCLTMLYRLKSGSPCIRAGQILNAPWSDIDGENRSGSRISFGVDIGADEFVDTDLDGLPDNWEMNFFGDLTHNATEDNDRVGGPDGLSNLAEYENGTDPTKSDTDGDGLLDLDEINIHGTSPIDADIDNDGLNDGDEIHHGTSPTNPDTDGDGLKDGEEIALPTSPTNPDTDGDGIDDGTEVSNGTSPQLAFDFDRDGMPDDWESHYGLNFANASDASEDPDGDGLTSLEEYNIGTDPKNFDAARPMK